MYSVKTTNCPAHETSKWYYWSQNAWSELASVTFTCLDEHNHDDFQFSDYLNDVFDFISSGQNGFISFFEKCFKFILKTVFSN